VGGSSISDTGTELAWGYESADAACLHRQSVIGSY
jgi:hypothetical protein